MKTGAEILKEILKHTGKKINSLAKEIGLTQSQSLYDIRDGDIKKISADLASKILKKYPEFNISWLLTGEGQMLINEPKNYPAHSPEQFSVQEDEKEITDDKKSIPTPAENESEIYKILREIKGYEALERPGLTSEEFLILKLFGENQELRGRIVNLEQKTKMLHQLNVSSGLKFDKIIGLLHRIVRGEKIAEGVLHDLF